MTSPASPRSVVGRSVAKLDGYALACGLARFTADEPPRGTLHAAILGSPHAHARIRRIDTAAALALPGVHAVLTYENVPRVAHTTAGQGYPEPSPYDSFLFDSKVRFVGDRVAAVAADTPAIAAEALARVVVDYEVLEPLLDPRRSLAPDAPCVHDEPDCRVVIPTVYEPRRNLAAHVDATFGDVDAALAAADVVRSAEFETHYAQHCAIEPHTALAYLDEFGRIVIRSSTQVPFHVRRIVAQCLQLPVKQIRVIKPRIGGGFGSKQEVLLEGVVALLALRTGRPVLLAYSRTEEFTASRTRHPQIVQLRAGVNRDGTLVGADLRVLMNTGAYGAHALTVVCNSGSKVLPLYRWQAVRFEADSVYTTLPVGGAYRGYGATQAAFANEVLLDELAAAIDMDPVALRLKNHIREGESSPLFGALGEGKPGVQMTITSCKLADCLERGAAAIGWTEKRARRDTGVVRRGVGVACLMQGSSIPEVDLGAASLKMNDDGSFTLLVGATDIGTGSDTVLAQIAAETLGVRHDDVIVYSSDTDLTPFDVGAYASSTTYLSGKAVEKAALAVAEQIRVVAADLLCGVEPAALRLSERRVVAPDGRSVTLEAVALRSLYERGQAQIGALTSHVTHKSPPPFAAHFAEVAVDTETGQVKVLQYVAAVDCGAVIHPRLAEGQTEGAVLNGISFALTERFIFDAKGRMLNPNFGHYKIFSTRDAPPLTTILVPSHEESGPYGAKSVSEISINGPMPAISNAIYHAVGVRLRKGPFTPEAVLAALRATRT